jgi:hypothetical protein
VGDSFVLVQNTSRYPTDEVRELVEFATADVDMRGVCVNVKNARAYACAGYAYDGVPEVSNAPRGSEYLVTIRLGPAKEFPSRMVHRKRSPVIEVACWREGLVTVAAHEAKHIEQYRRGEARSEVACERFAAWVLEVFRWGYEASTRVAAPSRESRIARMSSAEPTKIGVSRSV